MRKNIALLLTAAAILVAASPVAAQQTVVALETKGFAGNCPPALGTLYPKFSAEVKEASLAATRTCVESVGERLKAAEAFKGAEAKLKTVATDENATAVEIAQAKVDYLSAWSDLQVSQTPMQKANLAAETKYFDWSGKSSVNVSSNQYEMAEAAYNTWRDAVSEVEKYGPYNQKLMAQAELAAAKAEVRMAEKLEQLLKATATKQ
jgi:hypothetical protein